jgi:hypothetical protein
MTVYIANENGDWWEYVKDSVLYVLDDENAGVKELMSEEDTGPDADKFERFIQNNGEAIDLGKVRYQWN